MSSTFLSAASSAPEVSGECKADYKKLETCVKKAVKENLALGTKLGMTYANAEACVEGAADDAAKEACIMPAVELLRETCPSEVESMETSCAPSFEFQDFALDFAEQLEDGE